jgi:hypothetical protein
MENDFPCTGPLLRKLQRVVAKAPHEEALVSAFLLLAYLLSHHDKAERDMMVADLAAGIEEAIAGELRDWRH